jgi:hypothetical protein
MSHGMYEVMALIPESSDFTLERAGAHFASLNFSQYRSGRFVARNELVGAELATAEGEPTPTGFRVFFGRWAVVAWLDCGENVLADNRDLAEEDDLPASPGVIAGCSRRLWVWSDEDPYSDFTDLFNYFTDELRQRFGVFVSDAVNGDWWP